MATSRKISKKNDIYNQNTLRRGNVAPSLRKDKIKIDDGPTVSKAVVYFFIVILVGSVVFEAARLFLA
ncbi:hypothetical protein RI367_006123 [Sorochytrium milnesiophthora]